MFYELVLSDPWKVSLYFNYVFNIISDKTLKHILKDIYIQLVELLLHKQKNTSKQIDEFKQAFLASDVAKIKYKKLKKLFSKVSLDSSSDVLNGNTPSVIFNLVKQWVLEIKMTSLNKNIKECHGSCVYLCDDNEGKKDDDDDEPTVYILRL